MTLKLGYSEIEITPVGPVETIGFNRRDNISRGILKPLLAQIAVWDDEGIYCLVTIDSIGFKKDLCDNLRNRICKVLDTSFEKVMICFSHCHSAPNADAIPEYYEMVCKRLEVAARDAIKRLCEFALNVMQKLDDEFFYLNGYTNGCLSYFPTEEEFDLGGYEVYWSLLLYFSYFNRVFPLMRESATRLMDFVVRNVL